VATSKVVEGCKVQLAPASFDEKWSVYFPGGQLAAPQVLPIALPKSGKFEIDGHELHAVDVEFSDCEDSSYLHVPSLKLVVGGDIIYGDCYQHLGEANTKEKRGLWVAALDQIAALKPDIVVAGHKRATQIDGAYLIEATKKYIHDFEEELAKASGPEELEEAIRKRYPQRWNEFILSWSCQSAFA